jgi:hypothetical protein
MFEEFKKKTARDFIKSLINLANSLDNSKIEKEVVEIVVK